MGTAALQAADHTGSVTFRGLPVPGATVTAAQGDDPHVVAISDADGRFRLPDLHEGLWTIRVEMRGFRTLERALAVSGGAPPSEWELTALALAEMPELLQVLPGGAPVETGLSGATRQAALQPGDAFVRLQPQAMRTREDARDEGAEGAAAGADAPALQLELAEAVAVDGAADGVLVHGSVNNSAATPFAQPRAFGNNRPRPRSPYNITAGTLLGTSAWDARPHSFMADQAPRPDYRDVHVLTSIGGPVRLPGLRTRATFFLGYQRTADNDATTRSTRMPTARERAGDFSQTLDAFGQPVQIVDPETGLPFPGNVIPSERISPQAGALLGYYPLPATDAGGRFNYQVPLVADRHQHNVQSRLSQTIGRGSSLQLTANYQRGTSDRTTLFGLPEAGRSSGFNTQTTWTHRVSPTLSFRAAYGFTQQTSRTIPHFAHLQNVSGDAGIAGNNQDPEHWGPPRLTFAGGIAGLSDASHAWSRPRTHTWSAQGTWSSRGRHFVTFGGEVRRQRLDVDAQQDARGTFAFTGAFTGLDLADFLLGLPHTSTIAFGNPDKFFRGSAYDLYIADDWRIRAGLTANVGLRWEYEAPIAERFGRLVNLDLAPDFTASAPVLATDPMGALTGQRYPASLVRPDRRGIQPRLAIAWRPLPASSLIVRAGYGIYRNTNVYQPIATLLAQQPPLSTSGTLERSAAQPLTLADGFPAGPDEMRNTFAVDPDFRPGYAHNWQASVQRDIPRSLTMMVTYLGSKGSRLMQQFVPNTWPAGAENPCPGCPTGFVYLTSNGSSRRDAMQLQLRRRLQNGFTATLEYTLAKATDNATTFGAAGLGGGVAQNWLDLEAERAPSSFDQRHLGTVQAQYTTGARVFGSVLSDSWTGVLLRDWMFSGQFSTGSGLPLTPLYFSPLRGTGLIGPIRASTTGAPLDGIPDGSYLNPAAYGPPAPGEWGTAGRNSITGPRTFSLDAAVSRSFRLGGRFNLEWRLDAANVLNRVTHTGVDTSVTSPQFGLATSTGSMRRLRMSVRTRF